MPAPKGNQFWKLRTKHGRNRLWESPEVLWQAATEYFEAMDARTDWQRTEFVGKFGERQTVTLKPPYTLMGLMIFLDTNIVTFMKYEKLEDYVDTCTRIRDIIANQKFEGAAVGAYNANLISRDLGLVEKSNTTIAIEQPMFPDESKPKE
jgi:hypothetical protein